MNIIEKSYNWARGFSYRAKTTHAVIHHAAAATASPDDIHRWHLGNGWVGIGYHFVVRKDGSVYRGRPENTVGGHTTNMNSAAIGICFEGNFEVETMSAAQLKAGQELVAYLKARYPGIIVTRHKDHNATACPGKNFPFAEMVSGTTAATSTTALPALTRLLKRTTPMMQGEDVRALQASLNAKSYACGTADGIFGDKTLAAVRAFQAAKGLDVDGIVGPKTWAALGG